MDLIDRTCNCEAGCRLSKRRRWSTHSWFLWGVVTRRCKEALVWDMTGLNCSWGSSVKEGGGRESITRHKLHRRTHYLIPMQNWSQADRVADHSKQIIRPKGTKKEGCDHAFSLQKKFCSDIITSTIQTYSNQTKSNQVSMRTVCVVLYIYIRVCVCSPWSQNVQTLFLFEVHHFFLRRPGQWSSKKITCPSLASLIDISELLLHKIRTLCCHEMWDVRQDRNSSKKAHNP